MRRIKHSVQDLLRSTIPIFALLAFSILMYFTPATDTILRSIRIVSGVIALILMPGFYIAKLFFTDYPEIERFGFSFIFGLAFQSLVVLSLYSVGSLFFYDRIDFSLTILVLTFVSTSAIFVLQTLFKKSSQSVAEVKSLSLKAKGFARRNTFLIVVLTLSLALRLYYQSFFEAPVTDGALYMEMARNVETTGQFTSKVIKDSWSTQFFNELGLSQHPFTVLIMSIFFSIGGVSLSSAKLMTVFAGCLVVFIVYEICKQLFDKEAAMIAAIIASIHPMCLLFSSVIYGSEILGTLFMLTALFFFVRSLRGDSSSPRRCAVSAGLFAGLTLGTTNYNYWAFWFATLVPFVLVMREEQVSKHVKILKFFAAFFLVGGVIVTTFLTPDRYFIHPLTSTFWTIYCAFPVVFVAILFWKKNDRCISTMYWMGIVAFAVYQLVMIRTYYLGQIIPRDSVTNVISPLPGISLPLAILGVAYLQLMNLAAFSGFYHISWGIMIITSTQIIVFLAFLSFARLSKWKENLYAFSFPFFLSFTMTLFGFVPTLITFWAYRLYLATTPFLIMLSASTLGLFSKAISYLAVDVGKKAFRNRGFIIAASLAIICFVSSIFPLYSEWIVPMEGMHERAIYWEPAFEWIRMNTPEDAIIMARKPREFAWYTNRATVCPLGASKQGQFTIHTEELVDQILEFDVNYVVVDYLFDWEYPYLTYLYENPSEAPYGFSQVFSYEDYLGKLLIYNVTSVTGLLETKSSIPNDDAYTYGKFPDVNYGNLTKLLVGTGSDLSPLNTYLKFTLPTMSEEKEVVEAKLRLYTHNVIFEGTGGSSVNLTIFVDYVADDNWNEETLTYNNQPSLHPEVFNASQTKETYGPLEWITWDMTELVKKEYNEDGVITLCLEMGYLNIASTRVEFRSRTSSPVPELEISFSYVNLG